MNENPIILVIGSVTAKQYEPLRLELLRKGLKPRIKRLATPALAKLTATFYPSTLAAAERSEQITEVIVTHLLSSLDDHEVRRQAEDVRELELEDLRSELRRLDIEPSSVHIAVIHDELTDPYEEIFWMRATSRTMKS